MARGSGPGLGGRPGGGPEGGPGRRRTHAGPGEGGEVGAVHPTAPGSMGAGTSAARKSMAAVKSTLDEAKWKTLVSFLLAVLGG